MAITPIELGRLSLDDLEVIAQRFSAALQTIKEAQALLGGGQSASTPQTAVQQFRPQAQAITPEAQKELDDWRHSGARAKLMEQFKPEATAATPYDET